MGTRFWLVENVPTLAPKESLFLVFIPKKAFFVFGMERSWLVVKDLVSFFSLFFFVFKSQKVLVACGNQRDLEGFEGPFVLALEGLEAFKGFKRGSRYCRFQVAGWNQDLMSPSTVIGGSCFISADQAAVEASEFLSTECGTWSADGGTQCVAMFAVAAAAHLKTGGLRKWLSRLSLISMFQNCVMLRCSLWLFRS